jgi:hypothetical protein
VGRCVNRPQRGLSSWAPQLVWPAFGWPIQLR